MTAATISGTQSSPARGWAFTGTEPVTLEPGRGLTCVVHVQAGAPIERIAVDTLDEPTGAWRQYREGESFKVREGQRVLLRPRGSGGSGVTFAWSSK